MKSLKSLSEIAIMIEEVLGKTAATIFDENMEELVYFVRSSALNNPEITESTMRRELRKLSEGVLVASIKRFLNDKYADDFGNYELNIADDDSVYDRNMKPIEAIEKIKKCQKTMTRLMVSRGMYEFAKGRSLVKMMDSRVVQSFKPKVKMEQCSEAVPAQPVLELAEIEILRLERKLPALNSAEAALLSSLYSRLRTVRK